MNAKLITLSGIDGSGKSTQITSIQNYYRKLNSPFVYLWTRGGSTPGIEIIKLLSRKVAGKKLPPSGHSIQRDQMFKKNWIQNMWLMLSILDLLRIYSINIRWELWRGKTVICDRYLWDTLIDFKIMFPYIEIENWLLWKALVWCAPEPDVEFLLMIPIELSEKRCLQKFDPFPDTKEQRILRYALYKETSNLNKWSIIDATQPEEAVFVQIKHKLS